MCLIVTEHSARSNPLQEWACFSRVYSSSSGGTPPCRPHTEASNCRDEHYIVMRQRKSDNLKMLQPQQEFEISKLLLHSCIPPITGSIRGDSRLHSSKNYATHDSLSEPVGSIKHMVVNGTGAVVVCRMRLAALSCIRASP